MSVQPVRQGGTPPTAVLLDALGTLVELQPPWPRLVELLRSRHGIDVGWEDAKAALLAEISYYKDHHDEGKDGESLSNLRHRCAEVLQNNLPSITALSLEQVTELLLDSLRFVPYPDVADALARLRAMSLKLAVVSNWDVSLAGTLGELGIEGLVDAVVVSAEVGSRKPDRRIFELALERVGAEPPQAIFVGDSPETDVAGAAQAGIRPLLLNRTGGAADSDQMDQIFTLADLPELIAAQLP